VLFFDPIERVGTTTLLRVLRDEAGALWVTTLHSQYRFGLLGPVWRDPVNQEQVR
jgi:hypothetical protein